MTKSDPMTLLTRLEQRREIRNLMGRISHDYAVKQEAQVCERYFCSRPDICLRTNAGYYSGKNAVQGYFRALGEEIELSSRLIRAKFPEELGSKSDEEVYGVGMMTYLPFDSQVIEIAEDGQTAKGLWNVRGSYSRLEGCGPVAYWTYGWAAADFVLEDGTFKLWHLQLIFNVDHPCGVGFTEAPKAYEPVPEFAEMDGFRMPEPNVAGGFACFYPEREAVTSPACPVPYATFADTFSYGV